MTDPILLTRQDRASGTGMTDTLQNQKTKEAQLADSRRVLSDDRDRLFQSVTDENDELKRRLAGATDQTSAGSHTALFVYAVICLAFLTVVSIVVILIGRPDQDNTGTIAVIVAFVVPLSTALIAAAVQQVHLAVNSRLSQLVLLTRQAAKAEGRLAAVRDGTVAAATVSADPVRVGVVNTPLDVTALAGEKPPETPPRP